VLLLLLACDPEPAKVPDAEPGTDSAGEEGGGEEGGDGGTGPVDCGLAPEISLEGDAIPGQELRLSASTSAPAEARWSVDVGSIEGELWAIPADAAPFLDVVANLQVEVEAEGCLPESASLQVEVGHPMANRVVVLYNPGVEGSAEVAEAYAAARGLGPHQLCALESSDPSTVGVEEAHALLAGAEACAEAVGPQVLYLVPVWGFPYKVSGAILDFGSGLATTTSLDALLFFGERASRYTEARYNPIYQEGDSMAGVYAPFVPALELREAGQDFFLVSRIDGADAAAALELIARTLEAEALRDGAGLDGIVYVDGNRGDTPPATDEFGSYESGEWNMWGTRYLFEELDLYEVVWDGNAEELGTAPAPTDCPDALYYAGWYSYYNYNDCFTWATGAIGGHLDSCSACDIRAAGTWSGSALIDGITATFGAVNEPYVAGMPEYDQLFRYLSEGATFGEAAYESTVVGAWMMVFVGDPLYQPFVAGAP
jgi:uncharacterized protein (TIGR03790 family)